ncbi:hypothetical protein D3C87_1937010 [compost metagenome]
MDALLIESEYVGLATPNALSLVDAGGKASAMNFWSGAAFCSSAAEPSGPKKPTVVPLLMPVVIASNPAPSAPAWKQPPS